MSALEGQADKRPSMSPFDPERTYRLLILHRNFLYWIDPEVPNGDNLTPQIREALDERFRITGHPLCHQR